MLPMTVALSTSPSPANLPDVTDTVAPTRSRLSTSVTESVGDRGVVAPSVKETLVVVAATVGGSLTAVMSIVLVAVPVLLVLLPSFTVQTTVRVGLEQKSAGL